MTEFAPIQAVLGGWLIGFAAASYLVSHGRILGVSGLYTQFLSGEEKVKCRQSGATLAGMVAGSFVCYYGYRDFSYPGVVNWPAWRYGLAALLVGIGVNLGSGCTSGHGICGLGRLAKRSFLAVTCFMGTAIATASVSHVVEHGRASLGFASVSIPSTPSEYVLPLLCAVLLPCLLVLMDYLGSKVFLCNYAMDEHTRELNVDRVCHSSRLVVQSDPEGEGGTPVASPLQEDSIHSVNGKMKLGLALPCKEFVLFHMFMVGFTFSVGLGVSGMSNQGKVLSFLTLTNGSWDPSLAFVMGAALVPSFISNRMVKRLVDSKGCPNMGLQFTVPTRTDIDARLIIGSLTFGVGWGLAGWCPGPAMVNFIPSWAGDSQMAAFFVANLAIGIWLARLFFQLKEEYTTGSGTGSYLPWQSRPNVQKCDVCG
eukprot:CAMPEP_0177770874 /NCGR_PEP_ID=MMETSP0491_2-20121128/11207_1 /TAXON_ID=63592 /ORGANISM="Tetraselmis chuii, Strain PLY429" /LENGTH=424 /DNA_ID=CAMNT_0019288217 /DNA_START=119 /DNA_END=1393 /DNA_ORIENTATION=+